MRKPSTSGRFLDGVIALRSGDDTAAVEALGGVSPDHQQSFQFRYESVRALVDGGRPGPAAREWERVAEHLPPAAQAVLMPSWSATQTPGRPNTFITELAGTFTTGTVQISGVATGPGVVVSACLWSGTTAGGPHVSEFSPLLTAPFGEAATPGRENDLCWLCHERKVYENDSEGSRFRGQGGHGDHVRGLSVACYQCHDVHGNSFNKHLVRITAGAESSGTTAFTHNSAGAAV